MHRGMEIFACDHYVCGQLLVMQHVINLHNNSIIVSEFPRIISV